MAKKPRRAGNSVKRKQRTKPTRTTKATRPTQPKRVAKPTRKTIKLLMDEKDVGEAQALARAARVDLQVVSEPHLIDPITAVVIGGGALLVFKVAVDLIDKMRGGVFIDLQPRANYLIRRDRQVPAGWVIVLAVDGKSVKIETRDAPKDISERLLTEIVNGTLKTAGDVAKEATKALGAGKVEEGDI
jgi:hypothetical protein